jgi:hypothetical protein
VAQADYYRRQADICMRLSLMSEDSEISRFLLNKAIELMAQAGEAESRGPPPPEAHRQVAQQQQQIQAKPEDE